MQRDQESSSKTSPSESQSSAVGGHQVGAQDGAREYVRPTILSHSGEEILEDLGPAQACYPFDGGLN